MCAKNYMRIFHREKYILLAVVLFFVFAFSLLSPLTVRAEENETIVDNSEDLETVVDSDIEDTVSSGNTVIIFDDTGINEDSTEDYTVTDNDKVVYVTMLESDSNDTQAVDLSTLESYVSDIDNNIIDLMEVINRLEIYLLLLSVLIGGILIYIFIHWSLSKRG